MSVNGGTAEIARHIKSLAPHTLVMDGSFAKEERIESCYAREALKSKDVDILDYHYYGSEFCCPLADGKGWADKMVTAGDAHRVTREAAFAKKHGKA